MGVREFSASEFIHGLFISKKLFVNKITAASDRPKELPTGMRMAALLLGASSWQHLPAGMFLGGIKCWSNPSIWIRFVCSPRLGLVLKKRVQKHSRAKTQGKAKFKNPF